MMLKLDKNYISIGIVSLYGSVIPLALNDIFSFSYALIGAPVAVIFGMVISSFLEEKSLPLRIVGGIVAMGLLFMIITGISNIKDGMIKGKLPGKWEAGKYDERAALWSIKFENDSAYIQHYRDSLPVGYFFTVSNQSLHTTPTNLDEIDWSYEIVDITTSQLQLKDGRFEIILHRINQNGGL